MHLFGTMKWNRLRLIGSMGLLVLAAAGCDRTGGQAGGGGLIRDSQGDKEEWTIRCTRIETPNHQASAKLLADLLGKVPGLKAQSVRVASDAAGSTIYYGQYVKVGSPGGSLVFPEQYQKDIELIRSLAYGQQTPFFYAAPELARPAGLASGPPAEGDISTAKGSYSLLIAIFYNTPTFNERKQAAEEYTKVLRKDGYQAYFYHEPVRSFVYVGDFDQSDIVQTRDGQIAYGPRVEEFIARNPEQFKHQTENLHHMKRILPDGTELIPPSVLVPVPGKAGTDQKTQEPGQRMPGE